MVDIVVIMRENLVWAGDRQNPSCRTSLKRPRILDFILSAIEASSELIRRGQDLIFVTKYYSGYYEGELRRVIGGGGV